MKELVVLSGKGGTGKTSLVGSLAALAENKVMVDCDVDAADLHLLLKPQVEEDHEFRSGLVAAIDRDACTECGLCMEVCRFNAIHDFTVQPASCEGCGFCARACPLGPFHLRASRRSLVRLQFPLRPSGSCASRHW
jgi:MinD superfamily P-loop ATPase